MPSQSSSQLGLWRACVLAFTLLGASDTLGAQTTIKGRILYGPVNDDIGEPITPYGDADCEPRFTPCGYLHNGDPIAHVRVQLNSGTGMRDQAITGKNGRFSMEVNGTPSLTLVVKARNDYVTVKKYNGPLGNFATDDAVKVKIDISSLVDYSRSVVDLGDLTVTSDLVDYWYQGDDKTNPKNYVSRAFYITTAAQVAGKNIEQQLDIDLSNKVVVRMGLPGTAFYYTVTNTIFIANNRVDAFWHEYGHYLQDKLGAFDLIPAYAADGGHSPCMEMTGSTLLEICQSLPTLIDWIPLCSVLPNNDVPSPEWAWIEGFAEWTAMVNASDLYGDAKQPLNVDAVATAVRVSYGNSIEDNTIEDQICSPAHSAVEATVGAVLWDLVDDEQDEPNDTRVDEIAEASVADVLRVFDANVLGLSEFWDEWRRQHAGVVPDLYAAYAYNGITDVEQAIDEGDPEPVTLSSSTHEINEWTNDPYLGLTITDGIDATPENHDDISGSYRYFAVVDDEDDTKVVTTGVVSLHPDLQQLLPPSKELVQTYTLEVEDGANRYIHVNSEDMAGNGGTDTSHLGPFRVDTVEPYWIETPTIVPYGADPAVQTLAPTLVLTYPAEIKWSSDDALSGVASVVISFHDEDSRFLTEIHSTSQRSGSYTWHVDDVPITNSGRLTITVSDLAGNELEMSGAIRIVPPFEGSPSLLQASDAGPCEDGRITSGDLDRDKHDDVVLVCRTGPAAELMVFQGADGGLLLSQSFPWLPADDVILVDFDRDGDLDVATVSQAPPAGPAATVLEILANDGTGQLVNPFLSAPLGGMTHKTVRALRAGRLQELVLVVFGVSQTGAPVLRAFDNPTLAPRALPGLQPVDGDWEVADLDADGHQDLVALGIDAANDANLTVFWGSSGPFVREDVLGLVSATETDVGLGDFNSDGLVDIYAMWEGAGQDRATRLLGQSGAAGPGFDTAAAALALERQLAGGDGWIVDAENDAALEVLAMGEDATGAIGSWYLRNNDFRNLVAEDAPETMRPLSHTDTAWGDFDADGDLDVVQLGHDPTGFWIAHYSSNLGDYIQQNDAPPPPSNLDAAYDSVRGGYVFTWEGPILSADETPAGGFGYELRVGTTRGGSQVLSWSHPAGPSPQGSALEIFLALPKTTEYYYSVRTVDSGWLRSEPAGPRSTQP